MEVVRENRLDNISVADIELGECFVFTKSENFPNVKANGVYMRMDVVDKTPNILAVDVKSGTLITIKGAHLLDWPKVKPVKVKLLVDY